MCATGVGTLYDAPRDGEGPRQGRLLVVELGGAITDAAGIDEHDASPRSHEVGQHALDVHEPWEPRLHPVEDLALREPLPLRTSPRLGSDELDGTGPHGLGRKHLAAPEELDLAEIQHRALIAGIELGQTVDLVAPEVDPHRQLGRRRVHVDDPAPHRQLAAVLDLVFAPVAELHEPAHQLLVVEAITTRHHHRDRSVLEGSQPLQERTHRGHDHRRGGRPVAQSPQQTEPTTHRRELGADALEGKRVPRREQLDGVVTEEGTDVVAESLGGGDGGRHHEHGAALAESAHSRHHERDGRVGHSQRATARSHGVHHGGLVAKQRGKRAKAHPLRVPTTAAPAA